MWARITRHFVTPLHMASIAGNPLGIGLVIQDPSALITAARWVYVVIAVLWIGSTLRIRRAGWLVGGGIVACLWVWAVTNAPLERLYALGVGRDRLHNVGMCTVVAAGAPVLETWQVGQSHLGPGGRPHNVLWVFLVAALSGFDPERVYLVYALLPAAVMLTLALSLWLGLRPGAGRRSGLDAWQRAAIVCGALLMCSTPEEFGSRYGVPWAMLYLLKPNHALGLVLLPWLLRSVALTRGWLGRFRSALILQAMAWAFVQHAALATLGLLLFGSSRLLAKPSDKSGALDAIAPVGLNLVAALPLVPWISSAVRLLLATEPVSLATPWTHVFEPTVRAGIVFWLGAWGAVVAWGCTGRIGRLLAAQLGAGLVVWGGYLLLSPLGAAQQPDETYYWLRVLTGCLAGLGTWDLGGRIGEQLVWRADAPRRAVVLALLALPWSVPYWWDPVRMDRYFEGSRQPLDPIVAGAASYLRRETPSGSVLAGDPWFARDAAAFGARRSLTSMGLPPPEDLARRQEIRQTLLRSSDGDEVRRAAAIYGVTHLTVTRWVLDTYHITLRELEERRHLREVFNERGPGGRLLAIFEIEAPTGELELSQNQLGWRSPSIQ